ncbi:MAG: ABC transporter ATP-binding protein, partial [Firmicutes bacterium]|nr:ABC transporter ATP-binding protein [Bacillota bacterium]
GYDGKKVVEHITFSVNAGDYLCIVGENGAGKSTLLKTLLRLIPPLSGDFFTGDGLAPTEIGYLPQQTPMQRDFPASAREIVLSGFLNRSGFRPFYKRAEKLFAQKTMAKLGIAHLENSCYRELSGGQQQRVLLARALCATQKMLILDEPAAGLDPKAALDMYDIIQKLNREEGITVIMISHDLKSAVEFASHILHIGNRQVSFFGTRDEYRHSEAGHVFSAAGCRGECGA